MPYITSHFPPCASALQAPTVVPLRFRPRSSAVLELLPVAGAISLGIGLELRIKGRGKNLNPLRF
jgi:hypothetical protein